MCLPGRCALDGRHIMSRFKKLSHTIYECKYHIIFCPKYRYPIFDGKVGEYAKQQMYHLARQKDMVEVEEINRYERLGKRYWGRHLWSRGYCVSTVGLDEEQIRKYVRWQNHKDKQAEQLGLWQ